ncbi:MAG: PEGA domain-containing protein [Myxococcales bacterium]|nr:PEGA domain-containing protein [Myxococcales bacterium]
MAQWINRTALVAMVCTSALLGASVALAEDTTKARDAFLKAQTLYSAGKYKEALTKFEESLAAKPHPSTIFNIARCQDQLGDLVHAMTSYKEYLRLSPQATDADEVVKAIASIEGRLQAAGTQHLLVYVEPASARVTVDGKDIGASPASTTLAPGSHAVSISAPGFDRYERSFAMSASRSTEFTVSLRASTTPVQPAVKVEPVKATEPVKVAATDTPTTAILTPATSTELRDDLAPAPKRRVFTWVAAGTAGVAAGLGVVFAVMMKNNETALKMLDSDRTRAQANALYSGAFTMGTAATISFITAGVSAAAAVLLFFIEGA